MPKFERPSPEERQKLKLAESLNAKVDKKYRTRKGKAIKSQLLQIEEEQPGVIKKMLRATRNTRPPKKTKNGKRIYSGSGRSFDASFSSAFWEKFGFPCDCSICGDPIEENGKHGYAPSIDHIRPWATVKTELETMIVCKDGVHWSVVLSEVMRAAYQDENNLLPAHQGCNSNKNGPKDTDSIAPLNIGLCPGDDFCNEVKGA